MHCGLTTWLRSIDMDPEYLGVHSFDDLLAVSAALNRGEIEPLPGNPLYRPELSAFMR
ncbi:hypothetical protein [Nocardia sp. NBC_00511]|uniref:hypothetical protein n=1 Tax=Nocardia sp. NBC_00511 TaxID=2903591 RepID=UPI0030E3ED80